MAVAAILTVVHGGLGFVPLDSFITVSANYCYNIFPKDECVFKYQFTVHLDVISCF